VQTRDGWPITLYEYGSPEDTRPPVLLCHGAFSNHNIYDLGHGFGLAPHLSRDGRRVFALDLRGRGRSVPTNPLLRARVVLGRGWTVDDILDKDLPAAIGFVTRRTKSTRVDWVGHSMGGILIVAYLAATHDARVRRVVSVGSADFTTMEEARDDSQVRQMDLGVVLAPLFHTLPLVPAGSIARTMGLLAVRVAPRQAYPAWNGQNVEPSVLRRYLRTGLVDVSSRKLRRFRHISPPDTLAHYRHPTFWLAGPMDGLIAPEVTRRCFERAGAVEKRFQLYARATGYRADYGHSDLLIGRHVEEEVFPDIAAWIAP